MRRILDRLEYLPDVDLLCNPQLVPFYERFGMFSGFGMMLRRPMG
jgi:hypothetical protein